MKIGSKCAKCGYTTKSEHEMLNVVEGKTYCGKCITIEPKPLPRPKVGLLFTEFNYKQKAIDDIIQRVKNNKKALANMFKEQYIEPIDTEIIYSFINKYGKDGWEKIVKREVGRIMSKVEYTECDACRIKLPLFQQVTNHYCIAGDAQSIYCADCWKLMQKHIKIHEEAMMKFFEAEKTVGLKIRLKRIQEGK